MKRILAIDPGTTESGVILRSEITHFAAVLDNEDLRQRIIGGFFHAEVCAIEMIASYGMAVGKETFETVLWIGRFMERAEERMRVQLIYRRDIKIFLCGTMKAKDPNVRQALIDKHGAPGTKKKPGPTYGISGHLWSALAVSDYAQSISEAGE